jgi:hypothetical protein
LLEAGRDIDIWSEKVWWTALISAGTVCVMETLQTLVMGHFIMRSIANSAGGGACTIPFVARRGTNAPKPSHYCPLFFSPGRFHSLSHDNLIAHLLPGRSFPRDAQYLENNRRWRCRTHSNDPANCWTAKSSRRSCSSNTNRGRRPHCQEHGIRAQTVQRKARPTWRRVYVRGRSRRYARKRFSLHDLCAVVNG